MSLQSIKSCCDGESKFIIYYENNTVFTVCNNDSKKSEYKTGIKFVLDYTTKKEIALEEFLQ